MESSVFEVIETKPKEKKLNISIPIELEEHINSVTNDLKNKAPNLRFNTNAICVNALSKAVKKAQKELDKMKESPSPKSSTASNTQNSNLNKASVRAKSELEDL